MDSGMTMSMADMQMVFFTSKSTPLFSNGWTPSSTGAYAGTCIFLIILAAVYRGMFAAKHLLEQHWADQDTKRRYVVVAGKAGQAERAMSEASESKEGILMANGVEENVKIVSKHGKRVMPWRFSVDLPRALLVTVIVGVGYLL